MKTLTADQLRFGKLHAFQQIIEIFFPKKGFKESGAHGAGQVSYHLYVVFYMIHLYVVRNNPKCQISFFKHSGSKISIPEKNGKIFFLHLSFVYLLSELE